MLKLIGSRDGYFIEEKEDGTYRVDIGTINIRYTHKDNLTFEKAIEFLRPKAK
jgi:hypothetical protein